MAAELAAQKTPATAPERHRSFLAYRNFRWVKLALALCGASIAAYAVYDPTHGHSGNTWLGYTLGTIGALIIVWLAWFGVRKRRFAAGGGQMQGWTSAHVYLGLSLVVVATLHTGFQLGWNIHLLAYLLMLLVIASGIYGIIAYSVLPRRITANRQQTSPAAMQAEIARLDQTALRLADKIDPETHQVVARSVADVRIGGSAWQQLTGRYGRRQLSALEQFLSKKRGQIDVLSKAAAIKRQAEAASAENSGRPTRRGATIAFVTDQIFDAGRDPRGEDLQRLLSAIAQRKVLVERLNRDITQRARINLWLYLHVPLTVALLAALLVHIVSTFFYW